MTYFTQFPINLTRRQTRSMLASPYKMHAAIAGSFPAVYHASGESGRALWRIDNQHDGSALLYLVSPERPSLIGLDEQIGFPDLEPQWKTREYDPFLQQIAEGQEYFFRLVANPVVKARVEPGKDRKRVSHLTALQQAAWLVGKAAYEQSGINAPELFSGQELSRAERSGFRVCAGEPDGGLSLIVSESKKVVFKKADGNRVTIATARYDGVLEVLDAAALRETLVGGIGHAKGFGCGLLTLVPFER